MQKQYYTIETLYNALKRFGPDQKIGISEDNVRFIQVTFISTTSQKYAAVELDDVWNNLDFSFGPVSTTSRICGFLAGLLPEHATSTVTRGEKLFTLPKIKQICLHENEIKWYNTELNPYTQLHLIQPSLDQLVDLLSESKQEESVKTISSTSSSSTATFHSSTNDSNSIITVIGGWVMRKCKNKPDIKSVIRIYQVGVDIYSSISKLQGEYPHFSEDFDDCLFKVHEIFPFIRVCRIEPSKMTEIFEVKTKEKLLKQINSVLQTLS